MGSRPPILRTFGLSAQERVVDCFAGGGGASSGIVRAVGRPVDVAINHDPEAIAMHAANHPETRHYLSDIHEVDPVEAAGGQPVGLAWFSPACTHFSRAKGAQNPKSGEIRALSWVVIRWAETVRPRVICLENVEEFATWGPLDDAGLPIKDRAGETFRAWLARLVELGYEVAFRSLVAADYGAPTTRRRMYLVARCDGQPIVWPEETHGVGRPEAWRSAAEVIDWAIPCPSIFERRRPLAEATMRRIAQGIRRYVLECGDPFIVPLTHQGPRRMHGVDEPLRTVTAAHRGELALVSPFVVRHGHGHYSTITGAGLREVPTITGGGSHLAEVRAFLVKYYNLQAQQVLEPLHTVTTKARFGLVQIHGVDYQIVDIGMRMLAPRELFRAQGFTDDYQIAPEHNGRPLTKTAQIRLAGNSVCPPVAEDVVAANLRGAA